MRRTVDDLLIGAGTEKKAWDVIKAKMIDKDILRFGKRFENAEAFDYADPRSLLYDYYFAKSGGKRVPAGFINYRPYIPIASSSYNDLSMAKRFGLALQCT